MALKYWLNKCYKFAVLVLPRTLRLKTIIGVASHYLLALLFFVVTKFIRHPGLIHWYKICYLINKPECMPKSFVAPWSLYPPCLIFQWLILMSCGEKKISKHGRNRRDNISWSCYGELLWHSWTSYYEPLFSWSILQCFLVIFYLLFFLISKIIVTIVSCAYLDFKTKSSITV